MRRNRTATTTTMSSGKPTEFDHAFALLREGGYEDAVVEFESALARAPDKGAAWVGLGKAYWKMKAYDRAFHAFGRAAALRPRSEFASRGVFHSALRARRYDDAQREARRFLELHTTHGIECSAQTRALYDDWANDDGTLARVWDEHRARVSTVKLDSTNEEAMNDE
jgi:tetratricopeptide (TPR) repeat protein